MPFSCRLSRLLERGGHLQGCGEEKRSTNVCRDNALTELVSRISEIEEKIGAGLIEEVIQVAEGELRLVDTMLQNKV